MECPTCGGTGENFDSNVPMAQALFGPPASKIECEDCKGTGEIY